VRADGLCRQKHADGQIMSSPETIDGNLQSFLDVCPDGVIICNSAGCITAWNIAATQLLGWTREESVGRSPTEFLIKQEDCDDYYRWFHGLIEGRNPGRQESPKFLELTTKNGNAFAVEGDCGTLSIRGEPSVVVFIRQSRSMSSQRAVPVGCESSQSPEKAGKTAAVPTNGRDIATAARNEFLATVTHELRTPMNAILGMTELALHEELPEVVRDYLLTAKDSADTMLSLINDILDYTRADICRDPLDVVSFDVRQLLEVTLRGLSLCAHERGLELAASIDPDVPLRIYGDPARLRRLLSNLVSNSIKFTERGEIIVDVGLMEAESETDDAGEWRAGATASLHFSVKDTGIGIDPANHEHIFSPFVQVDSSTTRSYPGTGLGLSNCAQLARLMDGHIWVESALGQGSTFHFTASFKVAPASDDLAAASVIHPDELAGTRVLIIDDNESTRHILKEMVEAWAMKASIAESAETATQQIQAATASGEGFQLLIIDALMPVKDGVEFLRELKAANEETGASILMLSCSDQRFIRKRVAGLHVDAFLEKPVSQLGLLNSIAEAFQSVALIRTDGQPIESTSHGLRVLVVEDIPANQKVVTAILSRRGHEPTVAHNGREALDFFERDCFDVILMDIQMPILDGIQATKAIRGLEKVSGKRTPVVAMSAHSMPKDRDACLAAGMDAYLSKPLDAQLLLKTIEQLSQSQTFERELLASFITRSGVWRLRKEQTRSEPSHAKGESNVSEVLNPSDLWNPTVALRRMGADADLLASMVDYFLEDCPALLEELKQRLEAADESEATRVVHSLKGLCANFEAEAATRAAASVEAACIASQLDEASGLVLPLTEQLRELSLALTVWKESNSEAAG
jgi:two-component system sensor histidine kinase/response regulator